MKRERAAVAFYFRAALLVLAYFVATCAVVCLAIAIGMVVT